VALIAQPTLESLTVLVRDRINEATAVFWPDAQLQRWINDAVRIIAREAEVVQSFNTAIELVPGQNKYPLPTDFIRAHRCEFIPTGSTQTYPLRHSTYQEMDQMWGINQQTEGSYPLYFVIWGTPGIMPNADASLEVQFYPTPSQAGNINLFYYRFPQLMVAGTDVAEIPIGWDDMVAAYAEYMAKRKNRDPDWKTAKDEWDEKMQVLIDRTRQWHDQQRMIITPTAVQVPMWLYGGGDDW
jgi:hypothetical protein